MKKISAFTLAEVLITLGVIGVVAAITLPAIMENVTERINSERQANIAQKITQAMEQMRAHGLLNTQYSSTEAFVDELQKYLKVAKRCSSSNIAECWPTDTVTMSDGEELEVSKAKTGINLSLSTETNNVGLILADGASIILNYNPATQGLDVGDRVEASTKSLPVGFGKSKNFAYTSDVTNGIDFVMDVNGGKSPNSEVDNSARDIRSFKRAKFSRGGADCSKYPNSFEVPEVGCVVDVKKDYEPVTEGTDYIAWHDAGCQGAASYYCTSSTRMDYWTGAKNKCKSLNMHLTSMDELRELFKQGCSSNNPDINADKCVSEIPTSGNYWSTDELVVDAIPSAKIVYISVNSRGASYKYGQQNTMCVGN
ncbi:type II secretion system protein [bacterium]|nr:type II secretion system protein [bacterium]